MTFTLNNTNESLTNALNSLKADYTAENRADLEKALADLTADNKSATVSKFSALNGKDLFSALCTATDNREFKSERQKINFKVYTAVNYASYTLSGEKVADLTIKRAYKGITIADVLSAKEKSLAFKHADQKVTKADKTIALKNILGDNISELFLLFIDKSYCIITKEENSTDIYHNIEFTHCYNTIQETIADGKKNPFDNTSKGALQTQLQFIFSALLGEENSKKFIKKHALRLASALCNTNRKLSLNTASPLTAYDSFIYLARFALNDIMLPDNDKSGLHNIIVTESVNPDIIK